MTLGSLKIVDTFGEQVSGIYFNHLSWKTHLHSSCRPALDKKSALARQTVTQVRSQLLGRSAAAGGYLVCSPEESYLYFRCSWGDLYFGGRISKYYCSWPRGGGVGEWSKWGEVKTMNDDDTAKWHERQRWGMIFIRCCSGFFFFFLCAERVELDRNQNRRQVSEGEIINPRINKQKNIWAPVNNNLPFVFFRFHPLPWDGQKWRRNSRNNSQSHLMITCVLPPIFGAALQLRIFLYLSLLQHENHTTEAKLIGLRWTHNEECSIVMIFSLPSNSVLNVEHKNFIPFIISYRRCNSTKFPSSWNSTSHLQDLELDPLLKIHAIQEFFLRSCLSLIKSWTIILSLFETGVDVLVSNKGFSTTSTMWV